MMKRSLTARTAELSRYLEQCRAIASLLGEVAGDSYVTELASRGRKPELLFRKPRFTWRLLHLVEIALASSDLHTPSGDFAAFLGDLR